MIEPKMPAKGLMWTTAATQIIQMHQPAENKDCWANQRWCQGCSELSEFPYRGRNFRIFPWSDFPKHQAELIVEYIRGSLGTR